jgi:hypothetical protein
LGVHTPDVTVIAAGAQTLRSRVVRLLIDESMKTPGFARRISTLEDLLEVARRGGTAPQPQALISAISHDLGTIVPCLESHARDSPQAALAALLQEQAQQRAARLAASGQPLGRVGEELAGCLARLGTAVRQLESQLLPEAARARAAEQARPAPAGIRARASPAPSPGGRSGRTIPVAAAALSLLLAGVMVDHYLLPAHRDAARSARSAAPHAARRIAPSSASPPQDSTVAPSPPASPAWQRLWTQALLQPVSSCLENPEATTFLTCACPQVRPEELEGIDTPCQPDARWSGPLTVAALQAVLRVNQRQVWIDGELGTELSAALEQLKRSCVLTDEADEALDQLASRRPGARRRISPAAREAALLLLGVLQSDPACAGGA